MGDRTGQLDMTHAITAHLRKSHFHATLLADDTAMLETFVLATKTLIVFNRAKYLRAEQSVPLRFERTIVNSFWFLNLAE